MTKKKIDHAASEIAVHNIVAREFGVEIYDASDLSVFIRYVTIGALASVEEAEQVRVWLDNHKPT